jgi:hypothetical protein
VEQYLKTKQYYIDQYDQLTVEHCRKLEKRHRPHQRIKSEKPLTDKDKATVSAFNLIMYVEIGERYLRKEETIKAWMERDQERDDKLASATEPEVLCAKCNEKMECISKELRESNSREQVLFLFTCQSCKSHRAFFDNGEEYKPQRRLCPNCHTELIEKDVREGDKIISTYSCTSCGYKKQVTLDLGANKSEEKPDPNFEKDKTKFCLSEKDGGEYLQGKYNLEAFKNMKEEIEEREKNKEIYDTVAGIKKLTVQGLQQLLAPILEKNSYVKLNFAQPRIERQVTVDFIVQDAKNGREEYDSRKQLEKVTNESLGNVNWNLMSSGINYRLGILSGSLKGYEFEEDLVKLVQSRNKKKR